MRILIDSSLPNIEAAFPSPFIIGKYASVENLIELLPHYDSLVCRSTLQVSAKLLKNCNLQYVLTASSGTDHIDKKYLQARNIKLIDAKGANALAVADYVLATIASLSNQGISVGKKAGIIGVGEVGSKVLYYLMMLGFSVVTYDPLRALREKNFKSCSLEDLFNCNLLCVHAELHKVKPYGSANLINAMFLNNLQPNTIIINAARGGIINEQDLLTSKKMLNYCTDVYLNEPNINENIVDFAKICTPHIAGHSIEAKNESIINLSTKLHQELNYTVPKFNVIKTDVVHLNLSSIHWQKKILSYYDPYSESLILKENAAKDNFIKLRKAHNFRHNFSFYD